MDPSIGNPRGAAAKRGAALTLIVIGIIVAVFGALTIILHAADSAPGSRYQPATLNADDIREIAELPHVAVRLRERLDKSPADPDAWALLARTYVRLGEHAQAGVAFHRALEMRGGDAALLAECADTLAFLNGRNFEGEPRQLIDRALRIEPAHPAALMLAGLAAFDRQEYLQAVAYWEKAVEAAGPGSPAATQALEGIKEARRRAQSS